MYWPTSAPTGMPSSKPTQRPSASPTSTESPTFTPTPAPTSAPTFAPSALPTVAPTAAPSAVPTLAPTHEAVALQNTGFFGGENQTGNSVIIAMATLGGILCCACLAFVLYRRSRQQKKEEADANLSPYEKWMKNEELKNAGVTPSMHNSIQAQENAMRASLGGRNSLGGVEGFNPYADSMASSTPDMYDVYGGGPRPSGSPQPPQQQMGNGSTHNPMAPPMTPQGEPSNNPLGNYTHENQDIYVGSDQSPDRLHEPVGGHADEGYDNEYFDGNPMASPPMRSSSNPRASQSPGRRSVSPGAALGQVDSAPRGSMSPGVRPLSTRGKAGNPLRATSGRRASALPRQSVAGGGGDAAAAFMARKKRASRGDMSDL